MGEWKKVGTIAAAACMATGRRNQLRQSTGLGGLAWGVAPIYPAVITPADSWRRAGLQQQQAEYGGAEMADQLKHSAPPFSGR